MRGRYSDGRTAAARDVEASIEGDALVIREAQFAWPLSALRRVDTADRTRLVVEPEGADGERLTLSRAEAGPLLAAAPRLARRGTRRTTALAAGLIGTAALVVWVVVYGLPALSGPIARTIPPDTEKRLGAHAGDFMLGSACDVGPPAQALLGDLGRRFAAVSGSPFELEVELVHAGFPNAFALPGGRILVTAELLDMMERPEELAGVLAHETAHIARRHVMAAVLRELGYGVILDLMVGGGSGASQQIALAGASLAGLRHSRRSEAEADALALEYLEAADIDGTGLALFFDRLNVVIAKQGEDQLELAELLSTHPDTLRRAAAARAGAGQSRTPAMNEKQWALIKAACSPAAPVPAAKKPLGPEEERKGE